MATEKVDALARQSPGEKGRLLYFMDTHAVGGAEKYVADLLSGMESRGWEVMLLCHDHPPFIDYIRKQTGGQVLLFTRRFPSITRNRILQAGLSLNRSWKSRFSFLKSPGMIFFYLNMFRCYWMVRRFLKTAKPDVFHVVSGGYPASESHRAAVLAASHYGVSRRVLTFHNEAMPVPRGLGFIEHGIDRKVENSLHSIIAASRASENLLVARRGFRSDTVSVIPNGIAWPSQRATDRDSLRRALGVPARAQLIGTIGFLEPRKGHIFLLRAFSKIAAKFPTAHLVIIGSGPSSAELSDALRSLGLDGRVSLPGYVPEAAQFLPALDLFAFPSVDNECLPYVILNAMESALPIVATRVGGVSEQICDGVCGRLVSPRSDGELAEALGWMLENPKEAARMGQTARQHVEANFSLERMLQDTERTYRDGNSGSPIGRSSSRRK